MVLVPNFKLNQKFYASKSPTFHILTVATHCEQTKNQITMNKKTFNLILIIMSPILLIVLLEYGVFEKYLAYILIPILIAYYFLGQYSERKFKK